MKKIIYSVAAMALAFFAASCQQEMLETQAGSNTVTYTVDVPSAIATKAIGDEVTAVDKVYYEVYRAAEVEVLSKTPVYQGSEDVNSNGQASFDLEFVKNQEFVVLFWAQDADLVYDATDNPTGMYDIDDLRQIQLINPGAANNAAAQVFTGKDEVSNCASAANGNVTLTRPVSQINVYTTTESLSFGDVEIGLETSSMTVSGLYNTYNVAAGAAVEADENESTFVYAAATVPTVAADNADLTYVAMNYVGFAAHNGSTVNVDFSIKTSEANLITHKVANVPVKPNYRTNIIGNLITSKSDYVVKLDAEWGAPEELVEIWDGKTLTAPDYNTETKTWTIDNGAELAWIANAINGTLPEEEPVTRTDAATPAYDKTQVIVLSKDINLGDCEWTPIGTNAKHFMGLFDGNGHVISDFKITKKHNGGSQAAFFGTVSGSPTFRNVTIQNAKVVYPGEGDFYGAALIGTAYGNLTIQNVTVKNCEISGNNKVAGLLAHDGVVSSLNIDNCHVLNCEIVSAHETDGGNVGGLVGLFQGAPKSATSVAPYGDHIIKNSSVKNTVINAVNSTNSGKRSNGQFVACVTGKATLVINDCEVEGNTFTQNEGVTYVSPYGVFVGGDRLDDRKVTVIVDGNECLADGVTKDSEGNYYIYNAAGLKWVSKQVNTMEFYVSQAANIFDNKTVFVEKDIDLAGAEWTPIGDYAFSRTSFNGVFDGQNHTISNFKVTNPVAWTEKVTEASYGFFGNVKGTIKNVTIKNATVNPEGGRYSAALVGRLHNGGNIENCHVVSSSVTINHWQVGGLVGQNNNGNIKRCSVTGSTITGKAAVGAIVGMDMVAGEHSIENCRIVDNALVQNASFGASYDASYGLAVGLVNASGIILHLNEISMENNTIKGVVANTLVGDKENGAIVYLNGSLPVSTAEELSAALKAGGKYILTNNIAVKEATYQNVDFELDGNGYTISQAEGTTNAFGLFDSVTGKLTFKNVVFDGIKGGAAVRTTGAEFTLDNVTVKNCEHTQIYGLFRLIGKNVIKNCKFENNKCTTVITFNTEGDDNTDPQLVQNCEFKNNTCSATAVVHYSTGGSATIDGNKFLNNTLTVSNGATLYMGFKKNCTVTNNLFDGNVVTATSKRSSGGLMIGNASVVTGNAFVNNTVTVNGQTGYGNDVCASPYYAPIDLSGNYWGGEAPVENDDYYKEYNNYEVIINDYLTVNPFN